MIKLEKSQLKTINGGCSRTVNIDPIVKIQKKIKSPKK